MPLIDRLPRLPAALALATASLVHAQEAAHKLGAYVPPETQSFSPSPAMLLLRTIGSLVLVLSLIGGCAWLAKVKGGLGKAAPTSRMHVIETQPLGANRSLHLVAVGGRVLLLGGGDTINCLASFTDDEVDWSPAEADGPSFESWLTRLQWPGSEQASFGEEAAS